MFSQELIQSFVDGLVVFATDALMPLMVVMFAAGLFFRYMIYHTIKREHWFALEFEKRVDKFLEEERESDLKLSFYGSCKRLLEKCYYELFEVRAIMKRRKPDYIMSLADRLFLVQSGCARLVRDTLKQIRHLKHTGEHPKLLEISKNVFENNAAFSKVFGIIPSSGFNDILGILPGIFIISGIFGTFLGIMKALPELGGMDLNDIEGSKAVMDGFLLKISFAMSTSIVGIILSVGMTFMNTVFSPEKLFVTIVNKYENSLDNLWYRSSNNEIPPDASDFDEHKDSIEALAEQSLHKELDKNKKKWEREAS